MVTMMEPDVSSGTRKVAALMVMLGGDLAAPLLKGLRDDQIEAVTREIVRMDSLDDTEQLEILESCYQSARTRQAKGRSAEFARDLLARSVGTRRAEEVLAKVVDAESGAPFEFLKQTDLHQLVAYLEGEHPQMVALALTHVPTHLAGQVLSVLPMELQADVAMRMARMSRTDPEIVREVETAMKKKLASCTVEGYHAAGGMNYLVEVLASCDSATERAILEAIGESDPELADEIRENMFTFPDLAALDDRSIQQVLRGVDLRDLAVAMRGASDELRARIFANMSTRTAQLLRDEIIEIGPVKLRLVEDAQQKIVRLVRDLQEAEEIVVPRGRQDVFV